jgi:hypothetical protein
MIKKEVNNKICLLVVVAVLFQISFVFAGVGIKWDKESALINENEKTCLIYYVYNPWPEATTVKIELSDETGELNEILTDQESETKLIPANTPSIEAIPIEFCFRAPNVYDRDCLAGDLMCELVCDVDQKEFSGEVVVKSVPATTEIGGAGGSSTTMAVSAPLKIKIRCNPHDRSYVLLYAFIAILCVLVIVIMVVRKYRKPKIQRDEEALKKLQERIRKEKKKK